MNKTSITCIFDFDGTIADTYPIMIKGLREEGASYGLSQETINACETFRSMPLPVILKQLNIPLYKVPSLVIRMHRYMKNKQTIIQPHKGMQAVIESLAYRGYRLGIVTSNNKSNVETFLEQHSFPHFDFIHCDHSLFGKAKILKKVIYRYTLIPNQTYYIGDELRDIEAAQHCNIISVAVSWGYNTKELLASANPSYSVHNPEELLTLFH